MYRYNHQSYNEYVDAQVAKNVRKIGSVWTRKKDVKMLSEEMLSNAKFGICHGARNGREVEWFRKFTNAEVIGTDISYTATRFPNMIQKDFHETEEEWIGACDFIFSNALDHSHKPEECAKTWLSCLNKEGVCIVEWWPSEEPVDAADCLSASLDEYVGFFDIPGFNVEVLNRISNGRGQWVIAKRSREIPLL
jgi:hypothetical protein